MVSHNLRSPFDQSPPQLLGPLVDQSKTLFPAREPPAPASLPVLLLALRSICKHYSVRSAQVHEGLQSLVGATAPLRRQNPLSRAASFADHAREPAKRTK